MKPLSRRMLAELSSLEATLREIAATRNAALRIFAASRSVAIASAQREFWLEFLWADQEYRIAVHRLALFCVEHRWPKPALPEMLVNATPVQSAER